MSLVGAVAARQVVAPSGLKSRAGVSLVQPVLLGRNRIGTCLRRDVTGP